MLGGQGDAAYQGRDFGHRRAVSGMARSRAGAGDAFRFLK